MYLKGRTNVLFTRSYKHSDLLYVAIYQIFHALVNFRIIALMIDLHCINHVSALSLVTKLDSAHRSRNNDELCYV